jgi:hypothetical protein
VVLSKIIWRSIVMFFKQNKSKFVTRTTFFKDKSQKRNITEFRDLPGWFSDDNASCLCPGINVDLHLIYARSFQYQSSK